MNDAYRNELQAHERAERDAALGAIAARNKDTGRPRIEWQDVPSQPTIKVPTMHLGRQTREAGGGNDFIDALTWIVPDTGMTFSAHQTSFGNTWVEANPTQPNNDTNIEVLGFDQESGHQVWEGPNDSGKLRIDFNRHNDTRLPPVSWGNPGPRTGIVRVSTPDDMVPHYYYLHAQFDGLADSWEVSTHITEVIPKSLDDLASVAHPGAQPISNE